MSLTSSVLYLIFSGLAWVYFSHFLDPSGTTSLHENWHGFKHINISMLLSLIKVRDLSCLFPTFNQTMSLYHLGFLGLYLITCLYNIYPTSAMPRGIPRCPALAVYMTSTISILTLSTHRMSTYSWKNSLSSSSSASKSWLDSWGWNEIWV